MEEKEPKAKLTETLQAVLISLAVTTFVYLFVLTPNQILSISMEPTFYEGEMVLTNRLLQWFSGTGFGDAIGLSYNRGDVVVLQEPGQVDLIKRIVGLPGETIYVEDGQIYINDQLLDETYLDGSVNTYGGNFLHDGEPLVVPNDSFFVMGDNRARSLDSRSNSVGFVKREYLKGKVIFRYWPLDKLGGIGSGETALTDSN